MWKKNWVKYHRQTSPIKLLKTKKYGLPKKSPRTGQENWCNVEVNIVILMAKKYSIHGF